MDKKRFALVLESRPNSFDTINWQENNVCSLKEIDSFTSKYSEEDFRNFLVENDFIDEVDMYAPLQIIYNDNGVRRLNNGLLYKDEYNYNMILFIEEFIQNNPNDLNDLVQKIKNDRLISNYAKELIFTVFDNRKLPFDELKVILDELNDCYYEDKRSIYLYVKRLLEIRLEKQNKLILNKKSDEM